MYSLRRGDEQSVLKLNYPVLVPPVLVYLAISDTLS
jgi:hypothetical protein